MVKSVIWSLLYGTNRGFTAIGYTAISVIWSILIDNTVGVHYEVPGSHLVSKIYEANEEGGGGISLDPTEISYGTQ